MRKLNSLQDLSCLLPSKEDKKNEVKTVSSEPVVPPKNKVTKTYFIDPRTKELVCREFNR